MMGSNEIELEEQLKETGNLLLNPPSSIDELLHLLDNMECLLTKVEQMPSRSLQDALLPPMKALISNTLLRNSNENVKFYVASCICEIARITAPEVPYNDDQMKEIFGLIVTAIGKLSHLSSCLYTKAFSMLDVIAKVQLCLVMLDLDLDELVVEMFQHFLDIIRPDHPQAVFSAMKTIMTLVINESEEISLDLLKVLLGSVRKENQVVSPIGSKLAEKVMTNCATKLKPYLEIAVRSLGIPVDNYAPIVASVCWDKCRGVDLDYFISARLKTNVLSEDGAHPKEFIPSANGIHTLASRNGTASTENVDGAIHDNCSKLLEHHSLAQQSDKDDVQGIAETEITMETEPDTTRRKRGWKPNFFKNPDEGYDHSWICNGRKAAKLLREEKRPDKGRDDSPSENPLVEEVAVPMTQEGTGEMKGLSPESGEFLNGYSTSPAQRLPGTGNAKRGRRRKCTDSSPSPLSRKKIVDTQLEGSLSPNSGQDVHASSTSQIQSLSNGGQAKKARPRKRNHPSSLSLSSGKISSADPEEGMLASGDVSLRKSKHINDSESMQQKHSVILALAAKTFKRKKKSLALLKVKNEVLSEAEETSVHRDVDVGMQKVKKASSSVLKHSKKRKTADGSSDGNAMDRSSEGNAAIASGRKDNLVPDGVGNSLKKTPKSNVKRKRSPMKEVDSELPNFGEKLIGRKIKVWWPLDKTFYEGVVDSYDAIKKKHKILYADGDEETLNLRKQRWELIGSGTFPDKGRKSGLPETDASCDILKKRIGKANSESCKKRKSASSSKSSVSAVISMIKAEPDNTDDANTDDPTVDNLHNDSCKSGSNLKNDGKEPDGVKKPAIKLKILGPKLLTPLDDGQNQKFKIIGPKPITPLEDGQIEKPKGSPQAAKHPL